MDCDPGPPDIAPIAISFLYPSITFKNLMLTPVYSLCPDNVSFRVEITDLRAFCDNAMARL